MNSCYAELVSASKTLKRVQGNLIKLKLDEFICR